MQLVKCYSDGEALWTKGKENWVTVWYEMLAIFFNSSEMLIVNYGKGYMRLGYVVTVWYKMQAIFLIVVECL